MPTCTLRYCRNRTGKTNKSDGVPFHKFPQAGHGKTEAWIKFVRKNRSEESWLPSDSTVICSAHFRDVDKYVTKSGRIRLKKTAVPYEDPELPAENDKESSLSASVSSSEFIDTPIRIVLEKKLHKATAAKKKMHEKIKNLKKQNIYYKKKCDSYKKIIQNLKSKLSLDWNADNDLMAKAEVVELH